MSKTQQVVELVKEIESLDARRASKVLELQTLIGDKPKRSRASSISEDAEGSWGSAIEDYLAGHTGEACRMSDICEAIGCAPHVFRYHVAVLLELKRVKRVKRGYYQLRGRR